MLTDSLQWAVIQPMAMSVPIIVANELSQDIKEIRPFVKVFHLHFLDYSVAIFSVSLDLKQRDRPMNGC